MNIHLQNAKQDVKPLFSGSGTSTPNENKGQDQTYSMSDLYARLAQEVQNQSIDSFKPRKKIIGDSLLAPSSSSEPKPTTASPKLPNTEPIHPIQNRDELIEQLIPSIQANQKSIVQLTQTLAESQKRQLELESKKLNSSESKETSQDVSMRQLEERKEIKQDYRNAKQALLTTGIGSAFLSTAAIAAKATVFAAGVTVAAKAALLTPIIYMGYSVVNTATSLFTNPQTQNVIKDLKAKTKSFASSIWGKLKQGYTSIFGGKRSVSFAGNFERTREQSKTSQEESPAVLHASSLENTNSLEQEIKAFAERYAHIFNTFSLKPMHNLPEPQKIKAVQAMEKDLTLANIDFIAKTGTETDKAKAKTTQQFLQNLERLTNTLPDNFTSYTELQPIEQNLLRGMIFDTLTSGMDNLVAWGKTQGTLIGMTPDNINAVIAHTPENLLNQ